MLQHLFVRALPRMEASPHLPDLEEFATDLHATGYAWHTCQVLWLLVDRFHASLPERGADAADNCQQDDRCGQHTADKPFRQRTAKILR